MSCQRRHLWELDCFAKDAILCMAFEAQELQALCQQAGVLVEVDLCCGAAPSDDQVLTVVHAGCHQPTALAQRIEAILNERYEEAIERVALQAPGQLDRFVATADLVSLPALSGWCWALFSDSRDELRHARSVCLHRIKRAAFRALSFGKVELVKV